MNDKQRPKIFVAAAVIVFSFAAISSVGAQTMNEILSTMDKNRNELTSLKADIRMTEFEATLADETDRKGGLQYLPQKGKDAYFRIDWESPNDVLIVAAGRYLLWRKRLNTVISGNIDSAAKEKGTNNVLKFMSMSKAELSRNYRPKYIGKPSVSGTRTWHIELTPKGADSFTKAELWVDGTGMPIQARITMKNKDETTVRLSSVKKDAPIERAAFYPDLGNAKKIAG